MRIIAIDGIPGAGKSSLRSYLTDELGATGVEFDDFLEPQSGQYCADLNIPRLMAEIEQKHGLVVCSGVCMLKTFQLMSLVPSAVVYVKRMAKWGWADQDEIESQKIEGLGKVQDVNFKTDRLRAEVSSYHRDFAPQSRADIIFERLEVE